MSGGKPDLRRAVLRPANRALGGELASPSP